MRIRPLIRTLRSGDTRGRITALRSSGEALKVAVTGAALRAGLLDELASPSTTAEVASAHGWTDESLADAFLSVLAAYGLVRSTARGWETSRRGRRIAGDEIVRAVYEAFATYHTGLYRTLDEQLATGEHRRDIEQDGELIARLSRFMDAFVLAELDEVVGRQAPTRVLDVGCGAAAHLLHVLRAAPGASGVGVETDPEAAELARRAVDAAATGGRAAVVQADVRDYLEQSPGEMFDLVLLANVIYYVPLAQRVELLRALADRLTSGGRVVVVSTALTDDTFSRHFDLLLRAQASGAELPDVEVLREQLREVGLDPDPARRIAPGEPLVAVTAHRR